MSLNNAAGGATFDKYPATMELRLLRPFFGVGDSKRSDCCRGDDPAEPRLAVQSGINPANDPANSNCSGNNHGRHALKEDECVYAMVFFPSRLGLDLRLLENPIDAIRANAVQTLNAANRDDGRVGLCRLNGNLVAVTIFCARARMSVGHASVPCAYQSQPLRNPRAGARRPRKTLYARRDIRAEAEIYLAHLRHHAKSFLGDRP